MYVGLSMPGVNQVLSMPISDYIPLRHIEDARGAEAIVVLDSSTRRFQNHLDILELPDDSSVSRAMEAARIYHLLDQPLVFVSAGGKKNEPTWLPEGSMLRDTLIRLGVPHQKIILDSDSINTRAHAVNGIHYLAKNEIAKFVLVTSSLHMHRAVRSFQMLDSDPVPSPGNNIIDKVEGWKKFWPSLKSLILAQQIMHEYLGLVYYWYQGWI